MAHLAGRVVRDDCPNDLKADIELRGDLLVVLVSGTLSVDSTLRVMTHVVDAAAKSHRNRVLVDIIAVEGVLPTLERYRIGTGIAAIVAQQEITLAFAFVGQPPVTDGFATLVAKSRGVVAELFRSHDEALEWLDARPPLSAGTSGGSESKRR